MLSACSEQWFPYRVAGQSAVHAVAEVSLSTYEGMTHDRRSMPLAVLDHVGRAE